jgi:hypothetical protein
LLFRHSTRYLNCTNLLTNGVINSILANWLFFIIICIHNPFWKIIYLCFLFRVLSIVFHNPWAMETIRTWKLFERSYSTSELHNRTIQYNCTIYSTVVLHNRTIQYNCTTVQYSSIAHYYTVRSSNCTVLYGCAILLFCTIMQLYCIVRLCNTILYDRPIVLYCTVVLHNHTI